MLLEAIEQELTATNQATSGLDPANLPTRTYLALFLAWLNPNHGYLQREEEDEQEEEGGVMVPRL